MGTEGVFCGICLRLARLQLITKETSSSSRLNMPPRIFCILVLVYLAICPSPIFADESRARELLVNLVIGDEDTQEQTIQDLSKESDPIIGEMIAGWRVGNVFQYSDTTSETPIVLFKQNEAYTNLLNGEPISPDPVPSPDRPSRSLRKDLKKIVDLLDLNSTDSRKKSEAALKLGLSQNPDYLTDLRAKMELQSNPKVRDAFREAIYISMLANGTSEEQLEAVQQLGVMKSFPARDFIEAYLQPDSEASDEIIAAAKSAISKIEAHQRRIDLMGTIIRGISLGSILLLVSYGLAITFGQMGVINMAHGEFIAIGGYTVYLVQNYFANQFGTGSTAYGYYFVIAIPLAFLAAALVGIILEKGMIQFLYARPLESLLATWGISMVFQQAFRLYFGAANVSVSSPDWLAGSLFLGDVSISYARVALLCCVIVVVIGTYLLLSRTNWGLHVRATMQNRQMASSIGVPSGRVNMLTFAFGSGLAGLAGAFLSQIGNVGPAMGQTYIVDSFMVVVVGGVGNLLGTAISSLGIGLVDQGLQPVLGPVMGKISVLFGIILFLQFKPGGIFPSLSRSLDD